MNNKLALKDEILLTIDKPARYIGNEVNMVRKNPEHGFHAEFIENEGWDVRIGKLKLNTWYGTLIILGVVLGISILISEIMH